MKRLDKKILSAILPIPFFLVITFCCCLDGKAIAEETQSTHDHASHDHATHTVEKSQHSEHQHSDANHECSCPKHLSFLSAQSINFVFDAPVSQLLAKDFMVNLWLDNTILLSSLAKQSQGPPQQDASVQSSLPIYLKISNLRI